MAPSNQDLILEAIGLFCFGLIPPEVRVENEDLLLLGQVYLILL
jgi:hypothetical protein